ncbi:MAG: hypothetical protein LBT59_26715 [Clostridiales bacterium]|jgi:hypothetical protein|nr:hypothetical protein [Clostridiales bacterium]
MENSQSAIRQIKNIKKIYFLYGVLILAILIMAFILYGPKSQIERVTGAARAQSWKIESALKELNLKCKKLSKSSSPFVVGMDPTWSAYDMVNKDGKKYLIILLEENKTLMAVLNADGIILDGVIDSGMVPGLFDGNKGYIFGA